MKCSHPSTSLDSFEKRGYLRSVCCHCGAWQYINNPDDNLWHIPKSHEMSDEDAEHVSREVEEQIGWMKKP